MSRDNLYLHIHFSHYNQAQYIEEWKDYDIPFDDIDTTRLFEDTSSMFPNFMLDEDDAIPLNLTIFGAKVHKNKQHLKRQIWSDLNIGGILTRQPDASMLAPLHTSSREAESGLADFLANGRQLELADADILQDDVWAQELLANHTFNYKVQPTRSYSLLMLHPVQTPRIGKSRQPSLEKFQTPISRVMR